MVRNSPPPPMQLADITNAMLSFYTEQQNYCTGMNALLSTKLMQFLLKGPY